jgi:hypothetical protein
MMISASAFGQEDFPGRWFESFLLLLLMAVFAWKGFIPAWRSLNTDFPDYYLAARLYRQGYPVRRFYDWVWFQRQKDHAGLDQAHVSFIPHPPTEILPVLALSSLPPLVAKRCWLLINLTLLTLVMLLLDQVTQLGLRRVAIVAFLAVDALRTNFLFGQDHLLAALLLTLSLVLYLKRKGLAAGVILALGAALKIYPALFLFYFLRKRQWRAVAGLGLCLLSLGLLSLALFGFDNLRYYVVEVLPRSLAGEANDPYSAYWSSLTAWLRRLFIGEPELNPHPLVHFPLAYAILQPLCQGLLFVPSLWLMSLSRREDAREQLECGAYVVLLLVLSTNPAPYHFCALIVAAVLVTDYLLSCARRGRACTVILLYALVCFPVRRYWPGPLSAWQTFPTYFRLVGLTALWALLLWTLAGERLEPRASFKSAEVTAFGLLFVGLWTAGSWANLRHLNGLFANYGSRLVVTPDSIIATQPTVAGGRVLCSTMVPWGYTIASAEGGRLARLDLGGDAFSPTAWGADVVSAELASRTSQIVSLLPAGAPRGPGRLPAEAEDAEQPTVSADGKWLAFIRESRGRGSLWIKELRTTTRGLPVDMKESEVVANSSYDVLDAAFLADDRIIFAADLGASTQLFELDLKTGQAAPGPTSSQPARYPAVSPDGHWLAYSLDETGNWHLWLKNLGTGENRRLTEGDCNSTSPAWFGDSETLVYATDCGRALGLTALCRIRVGP